MTIKLRNLHEEVRSRLNSAGFVISPNANIIYVDSGNATTGTGKLGTSPQNPISTINEALTVGTSGIAANNGDVVVVLPGHAESIANATDLVPDVAGVAIIGIGHGADRPTLTFTGTAANIPISGAGVVFENFLFVAPTGAIDVVAAITVTAADVTIRDIESRDSSNNQWIDFIVLAAGSDRAHVDGLRMVNVVDTASQTAISIVGGVVDGVTLENLNIDGGYTTAVIENITNVATNLMIRNVHLRQRHASQDAMIDLVATTTGWIDGVRLRVLGTDFAGFSGVLVDTDAMQIYDVLVVNVDGQQGVAPALPYSSPNAAAAGFAVDMTKWSIVTKSLAGDGNLFVVTDKCLIKLFGVVTTAIDGGSLDYQLTLSGSTAELSKITICDGDPAGTIYSVPGTAQVELNLGVAGEFIVDGETIELDLTGTIASSAILWTCLYVPLSAAATVAAG